MSVETVLRIVGYIQCYIQNRNCTSDILLNRLLVYIRLIPVTDLTGDSQYCKSKTLPLYIDKVVTILSATLHSFGGMTSKKDPESNTINRNKHLLT